MGRFGFSTLWFLLLFSTGEEIGEAAFGRKILLWRSSQNFRRVRMTWRACLNVDFYNPSQRFYWSGNSFSLLVF